MQLCIDRTAALELKGNLKQSRVKIVQHIEALYTANLYSMFAFFLIHFTSLFQLLLFEHYLFLASYSIHDLFLAQVSVLD